MIVNLELTSFERVNQIGGRTVNAEAVKTLFAKGMSRMEDSKRDVAHYLHLDAAYDPIFILYYTCV